MLRRLLRCFAVVLLLLSFSAPFAVGQGGMPTIERGVKLETPAEGDKSDSSSSPALPYFVMAIYTMLVLTIAYMPTRQA
jgi:hypothetical protein